MRPLRLTLEGLTAFRNPTELDFRDLQLFAITGPTGSGKSSLLDAITFALYGEVERVGRRIDDLISHGAPALRVALEFGVGGRRFRVARSRRRRGGGEAILEEIVAERERHLATGVREVDRKIAQLVGLPYEAFVQAALLPQGTFARFLRSEPKRRREILRQLLRLQRYKKMQELAALQRRLLEQELRELERRLAEEYADVTASHLEALQVELSQIIDRERALSRALATAQEEFRELSERYRKGKALQELARELEGLERLREEMEEKAHRLERAEQALRIWPDLQLARRAREREEALRAALREITDRYRRTSDGFQRAQERLKRLEQEGSELDRLRERWRKLLQIEGFLEMDRRLRKRRRGLEQELAGVEAEIAQLSDRRERWERFKRQMAELERLLSELEADRDLLERLERNLPTALRLKALEERLGDTEAQISRLEAARSEAEERCRLLARQLREIEDRLHRLHLERSAAQLRRALGRGRTCPVCLQEVHQLPPELPEASAPFLELERRLTELRERAQEARADQDRLAGKLTLCLEERRRLQQERALLEHQLRTAFPEAGSSPADWVVGTHRRLGTLRQRWETVAEELERKRAESRRLEREMDRLRSLETERERRRAELSELEREMAQVEARIRQATDHPDPAREREHLKERIAQLESALSQAKESFEEHRRELAKLEAEVALYRAQLGEAEREAKERWEALKSALAALNFATPDQVEAAYLPETAFRQLQEEVERYRRRRTQLCEQIAALEREVGPEPPSEEAYREAKEALARLEEDLRLLIERRALLEREQKQLRERMVQAERLRERLEAVRTAFGCYRQLADDLRDDRFQEFLLQELFGELVIGASDRLLEMTGRYRLQYEGGNFFVVDEEHGGERRRAETLSGGETFLASLALALELSEQVCRHAGGVVLESLFIDEGFGTLDPEALDKVAGVLDRLLETGRMVGIITHISELAIRLPARIEVTKTPSGSLLRTVF